eukprot:762961-Hanusia_phi.AAC.16
MGGTRQKSDRSMTDGCMTVSFTAKGSCLHRKERSITASGFMARSMEKGSCSTTRRQSTSAASSRTCTAADVLPSLPQSPHTCCRRKYGSLKVKDVTYSGPFEGTAERDYAEAIIPLKEEQEEQEKEGEEEGDRGQEKAKSSGQESSKQQDVQGDEVSANNEGGRAGDEEVSYGRQDFDDGVLYMGEWVRGYRHGRGTSKWPDGSVYMGQWLEGQVAGAGKHNWEDGSW